MNKNLKVYLAIPYTGMEEKSFKTVNAIAAKLFRNGQIVYSPISHWHSVALENDLPTVWDYWERLDTEFLKWCDYILMVDVGENGKELIKNSKGCTAELKIAKDLGKEIKYYKIKDWL